MSPFHLGEQSKLKFFRPLFSAANSLKNDPESAWTPAPFKKNGLKPSLAPGIRIYALSDIHGHAELLRQMFTVIDADLARLPPCRPIHVFLGDYIDRGPDSRKTIELLIDRSQHHESVFLKGNHEAFFLEVLSDASKLHDWYRFGGIQTALSYGLEPPFNPNEDEQEKFVRKLKSRIPEHHWQFLRDLELSFSCGDFFFVHAGVRPGVPLGRQKEEDLLWIRDEFLRCDAAFDKFVVHGHTPVSRPDIKPNRINIDTGAYATGNLTLLTMQGTSMLPL